MNGGFTAFGRTQNWVRARQTAFIQTLAELRGLVICSAERNCEAAAERCSRANVEIVKSAGNPLAPTRCGAILARVPSQRGDHGQHGGGCGRMDAVSHAHSGCWILMDAV